MLGGFFLQAAIEQLRQTLPLRAREQMCVDERQPAFFAEHQESLLVQLGKFLLVNNHKAGEINALVAANIDLGFTVHQNTGIGQGLGELNRLLGSCVRIPARY